MHWQPELTALPRPPSWNKDEKEGNGKEGEGKRERGKEGEERRDKEEREGRGKRREREGKRRGRKGEGAGVPTKLQLHQLMSVGWSYECDTLVQTQKSDTIRRLRNSKSISGVV